MQTNNVFVDFNRIADLMIEAESTTAITPLPLLRAKFLCAKIAFQCGSNFNTIWNAAVELAFPTPQPERNVSYPGSRRHN